MILQKILVYLPHIGIFLPSPYKVQLLRRYCNDITPKVLLKYSRNTCVSSSYLASFFLHSNYSKNTLEIHYKYSTVEILNFLTFGLFLSLLYNSSTNTSCLASLTSQQIVLKLHSTLNSYFGVSHQRPEALQSRTKQRDWKSLLGHIRLSSLIL